MRSAALTVLVIVDTIVLGWLLQRNLSLQAQVRALQITVAKYVALGDPTVARLQKQRNQTPLQHDAILATFLAECQSLQEGGLPLSGKQLEAARQILMPNMSDCERLKSLEGSLTQEFSALQIVLDAAQRSYIEAHGAAVHEHRKQLAAELASGQVMSPCQAMAAFLRK